MSYVEWAGGGAIDGASNKMDFNGIAMQTGQEYWPDLSDLQF